MSVNLNISVNYLLPFNILCSQIPSSGLQEDIILLEVSSAYTDLFHVCQRYPLWCELRYSLGSQLGFLGKNE